ncbi:sigma-70 family RNA polymerase sigma factor [Acidithiobacillus montserratensis]|uniref:Sigma-70 family RNA polymerase sigma factor n=1 Tax=Acidithiobacillus montserratensis TaxID=2729135 RepID=A0ACD5HJT7_9PROT|nr:sigma-70 family RNA polymerase sigma factor [Acidithiobacillaceae bacterium]MBU2747725.1 sigma-70 family RNA polymerase sigma factor [Acidithiobacillus montserratensis]
MPEIAELEKLLQKIALADQQAFRDFYDATAAHLYPVALRILREEGRAAECLQDAFVKIWLKASEYQIGRGAPLAWAAAVVRYQAIDDLRRLPKDQPGWEEEDWEHWGGQESSPDAPMSSERQRLQDCLGRLPSDQRQAISQAFYRAASYEEVARFAGEALGTVKSWIRRGLLSLRDCLHHASE